MNVLPVVDTPGAMEYQWFCVVCKKKSKETFNGHWEGREAAHLDGRRHCERNHGGRLWPNHDTTFKDLDKQKRVRVAQSRLKHTASSKKSPSPVSKKKEPVPKPRIYHRKHKAAP